LDGGTGDERLELVPVGVSGRGPPPRTDRRHPALGRRVPRLRAPGQLRRPPTRKPARPVLPPVLASRGPEASTSFPRPFFRLEEPSGPALNVSCSTRDPFGRTKSLSCSTKRVSRRAKRVSRSTGNPFG